MALILWLNSYTIFFRYILCYIQ